MTATTLPRPPLSAGLAVEEFDARDWRKDELITLARTLGIPSWGKKPALMARVRRQLVAQQERAAQVITVPTDIVAVAVVHSSPSEEVVAQESAVSVASAVTRPQFFREVPGQTRAQALAAWYASRKVKGP